MQHGVTWAPSINANGYNIKRSTVSGGPYNTIATGITTNSFMDAGLTNFTTYYYVVSAINANGESSASVEVSSVPATIVIVDDADASGVMKAGTWTSSMTVGGYYGTDYLHDGNTSGGKSVRFAPTLPAGGNYEVYVRWTSDANRATNVPVDVNYAGGAMTARVNQQLNGGTWILLGTYSFDSGISGNVTVRNDGANGYVVADAVKFVQLSNPALLLDFGPTAVAATNATLSPAHAAGAMANTETNWNTGLTADTSSLVYSDGSTATGVSIIVGRSTADSDTIDFSLKPRNSALGGFGKGGIYTGSSPAKDAIFGQSGGGDTYQSNIAVGLRVDGLSAGTYTIYFHCRNTSTFDSGNPSSGATPQRFYAKAGPNVSTYSFSTADSHADVANSVPMNTNAFVQGDNYNFVTATVASGQSLFLAVEGTSSVEQRGFLNTVELVPAITALADARLQIAIRPAVGVRTDGRKVILTWPSVPGGLYQVQFSDSVSNPNWTDVGPVVLASDIWSSITNFITGDSGFYRVQRR